VASRRAVVLRALGWMEDERERGRIVRGALEGCACGQVRALRRELEKGLKARGVHGVGDVGALELLGCVAMLVAEPGGE
jgi:hypothetical protein